MRYKIIARIIDGNNTIGYQLQVLDTGKIINMPKHKVLQVAQSGIIDNATYNKYNDTLNGVGIDLRNIKSINKQDMQSSLEYNNRYTNHELANLYQLKLKLINKKSPIEYRLISRDRVVLTDILNREYTGKIVIPSFITDIDEDLISEGNLFRDCQYSEIHILNKSKQPYDASNLFANMKSTKLKVVFSHPECIVSTEAMFNECHNLIELDISALNTGNVTNMSWMFGNCKSLKKLSLKNFDTNNVTNMSWMFNGCTSLIFLDISSFNTERVVNMNKMFCGCESLLDLDLSNFKATNLEYWTNMFTDCKSLKNLNLRGFNPRQISSRYPYLFYNCNSLSTLCIGSSDTLLKEVQNCNLMCKIIEV